MTYLSTWNFVCQWEHTETETGQLPGNTCKRLKVQLWKGVDFTVPHCIIISCSITIINQKSTVIFCVSPSSCFLRAAEFLFMCHGLLYFFYSLLIMIIPIWLLILRYVVKTLPDSLENVPLFDSSVLKGHCCIVLVTKYDTFWCDFMELAMAHVIYIDFKVNLDAPKPGNQRTYSFNINLWYLIDKILMNSWR